MDKRPVAPADVGNVALWEEHCRKIHACARDLIDEKLTVSNAAMAITTLAFWMLAEDDTDLWVFAAIADETVGLPVGPERKLWAKEALQREDPKIDALEAEWKPIALAAAHRLTERYRWALGVRRQRHDSGKAT